MKRIVMSLLMAVILISLTACGGNAEQGGKLASDTLERKQSFVLTGEPESASDQTETGGIPEPSEDMALIGMDGTDAASS